MWPSPKFIAFIFFCEACRSELLLSMRAPQAFDVQTQIDKEKRCFRLHCKYRICSCFFFDCAPINRRPSRIVHFLIHGHVALRNAHCCVLQHPYYPKSSKQSYVVENKSPYALQFETYDSRPTDFHVEKKKSPA